MVRLLWVVLGCKSGKGGVVRMLGLCHLDCSCSGQCRQPIGAQRFPSTQSIGFSLVHQVGGNLDIADCIRAYVAMARHAVFVTMYPALRKLAAFKPDRQPLLKCKQERDATALGAASVVVVGVAFWVFRSLFNVLLTGYLPLLLRVGSSPRSFQSDDFRAICSAPCAVIRQLLLSAILGISHRFLSARDVVRGGASAETPTPSRLYHALPQGAC